MKLKLEIVGRITQHKLVEIEGKRPFLDIDIDVVLKTPSGKEYTHWVSCKVWHPLAEKTAQLLSNGSMVAVSGRPEVHPYSRRDGSPAAELIVHAEEIQVLDGDDTTEG
jgi:single-stranded DNA-binding protein